MVALRDYQAKGIADIRGALAAGAKAPCFVLPTGGGKTTMFGSMSHSAILKGRRVMVLAHRRELITQAANRLELFGLNPARVMPGGRPGDGRSFVASVQTLKGRLGEIPEPDLLVVDECHHAPAGTWSAIRQAWPNATYVGFTATPIRTDGRGLRESFDAMVLGPTAKALTAQGHLVPFEVLAPSLPDLTGVPRRGGDYDPLALAEALERKRVVGDAVRTWRAHFPHGGRAVAFCASVAHAQRVAAAFNQARIPAAVLTGEDRQEDRDATLAGLACGTVEVLCTVEVISEGFDLPALDAVIWLRATESLGFWIQGCGRAARPHGDKTRALILDHVGNTYRHWWPDEEHQWTLEGRKAKPRAETHTEDGQALSLLRCPHCYTMHPTAPVCPRCGFKHAPDERIPAARAGALRALAAADAKAAAQAAKEAATRQRKQEERACASLDDWKALGKKRGHKPSWAHVQWKIREGYKRPKAPPPMVGADGWPL